ncbi:MAG: GNAT family N-acetyltransferase [Candidimonas sp.]
MKIFEITTIDHTDDDEKFFNERILQWYQRDSKRYNLKNISTHNGISIKASHWPPQFHSFVYFIDDDQPIGMAIIHQLSGPNTDTPEKPISHKVSMIFIKQKYRRRGLGRHFYNLLKSETLLLPDESQTLSAQSLWKSL